METGAEGSRRRGGSPGSRRLHAWLQCWQRPLSEVGWQRGEQGTSSRSCSRIPLYTCEVLSSLGLSWSLSTAITLSRNK